MPELKERAIAPSEGEYAPYFGRYVKGVPDGDVVATIRGQLRETMKLLRGLDPALTTAGYAPGKWSIRDIVLHVADTERVMAYRALRIARGDTTPLPGFDEKVYAPNAGANARTMESLLNELSATRASTIALLEGLPADAWTRRGTASDAPISVRGLAWIIAGHERHHVAIIRDRYLGAAAS